MTSSNGQTVYDILGRNPVHPFPARMAPGIALSVLAKPGPSLRVLDPMTGSGTVLAVARGRGPRLMAVWLHPCAVFVSCVWASSMDVDMAGRRGTKKLQSAGQVFKSLRSRDSYPSNADAETCDFVCFCFD